MPGLLEDLDRMESCKDKEKQDRLRRELITKCWAHDEQLRAWMALLPPSPDICDRVCQRPETSPASVEDIALTSGLHNFWITCLLLYGTLRQASGPMATLPDRMDPQVYIHNLVSTAPILLNPRSGMYGQHVTILPFALALQYSESSAEQLGTSKILEGPQGQLIRSLW